MNHYERIAGLAEERQRVTDAVDRLLTNTAHASSGRLNVVALAEEAGINRTSLYQRHRDLVDDFKIRAGLAPASPTAQAIQGQLDAARARITELEQANTAQSQQIRTLTALVVELDLATAGRTNVIPLKR